MSQFPNAELAGRRASYQRNTNYLLRWPLRPIWRAALFLLPIIAVSVWLSLEVTRIARVTFQVDTVSIDDISKAIHEDPNNADLIHRLGVVYSANPNDVNVSEAVANLRKAIAINPRRWDYWADLGTSCDFAGDRACSDEAFARAVALNPMTPSLQWSVANHYLVTDRPEQAFPHFRELLETDPDYLGATFRLLTRATRDPHAIYTEAIPQGKDASARFDFLLFLSSSADYENAMWVWEQMISGPDRSPSVQQVKPFMDFLLDHNRVQDVSTVWNDLQRAGIVPPSPDAQDTNLLYDGGFERPPLDTGFDWRMSTSPDLTYDFMDSSAHGGAQCLRIEFAVGRNATYNLLNQTVRVKPNTRYQLTAFVKSDSLTSDSGLRLRVDELGCENCADRESDPTVGTTAWHEVDIAFFTQPQTQAVRITFWRPIDRTSTRDITGTVWLDDVTLRSVESPGPGVNQARTK